MHRVALAPASTVQHREAMRDPVAPIRGRSEADAAAHAPKARKASYTRKAGHTTALSKPTTPIQKPVACAM